jgi:DNA-binding CsgD family transcriptional regulator
MRRPHAENWLVGTLPGDVLIRRLLPVTLGLPIIASVLRAIGQYKGVYSNDVGIGIMAVFSAVGASSLLVMTARSLNNVERGRRAAEERLRRTLELYRTLARNLPNAAVLLFNRELVHRIADGPELARAGFTREEIEGKTLAEAFPRETATALQGPYRDALVGRATTVEVRLGPRMLLVQVSPACDEETGVIFGGLALAQEVDAPSEPANGNGRTRNLTRREREILSILAEGCTNEEAGRRLGISAETVQTHVYNAMKKLGAETRTQAVATAVREALIG